MLEADYLIKNRIGLKVLTDTGWSKFDGVVARGNKKVLEIQTNENTIKVTPEHKFYTKNLQSIEANELISGLTILYNDQVVKHVEERTDEIVYDLVNVENNHRFYANNLLVANCRFISAEETLIAPAKLADLEKQEPIFKIGQVRWYKQPKRDSIYCVALDPSVGTGGDYAAIQVYAVSYTHLTLPTKRIV